MSAYLIIKWLSYQRTMPFLLRLGFEEGKNNNDNEQKKKKTAGVPANNEDRGS